MKTKKLLFLIMSAIFMSAFFGCGKYENGPTFSLASKKSRIVNQWKVQKATGFGGTDYTDSYENETIEFKKDNTFIIIDGSSTYSGTWDFDGSKENLLLTETGDTYGVVYQILRLKSNSLWLKGADSYSMEIHYISK